MRAIVTTFLIGCGSSGSGPIDGPTDGKSTDAPSATTIVHGNLGAIPFGARDAIWDTALASGAGFNGMSTIVQVSDFSGACSVQMTNTGIPNGRLLVFFLAVTDAANNASPISAPGTYAVYPGATTPASSHLAEVYFEADDATCRKSTSAIGMSGSVTVTSATNPQQATFDVTFSNGDHITGSYTATSCTALDPNRSPPC